VLAGTSNFDNLRRHSDEECRTYQLSTAIPFSSEAALWKVRQSACRSEMPIGLQK
jgi:hypothetical protein